MCQISNVICLSMQLIDFLTSIYSSFFRANLRPRVERLRTCHSHLDRALFRLKPKFVYR